MAASPNGKLFTLFSEDGRLKVVSADFQKTLAEIDTGISAPLSQMEWCGVDSIVLHWPGTVWVVGPAGDWIKYSYNGAVHLAPEADGLRIFSSEACEYLQRVPKATEDVFKIGSTSPGSILYDARDLYEVCLTK